jgi:hypothetical protein
MRLATALLLASSVLSAACGGAEGDSAAATVTESDTTRCGSSAAIYNNHTQNPRDLHVRVRNGCMDIDTIQPARPARLRVLDAQNNVVGNQDVQIPPQTTHRGTFNVPGGARLQLDCPGFALRDGCTWTYQYVLR